MAEKKSDDVVARTSAPAWSDLPSDLFGLIVCHLNLVDRFHLALTCKRLLAIVHAAPRHSGLLLGSPCLFLLANGNKTCSLINPENKEKYKLNTASLPSKVSILSSKDGWLLILARDERSIFFFNPLTKATIRLPDIDFHCTCAFSLSCSPISPDCVVIAICPYDATIYSCGRGDKRWTTRENDMDAFTVTCTYPVFYQGSFYCLSDEGSLGVFDPVEETWIVTTQIQNVTRFNSHRIHVVESNGELLRVCVKPNGEEVYVCKLDPTCKRWEEIGLTDRQLYVGRIASQGISGKGPGRIYFPLLTVLGDDDVIVFYSCDTGEVYPRGNFYGSKEFPLACWIEPRWVQPSVEELQWSVPQ